VTGHPALAWVSGLLSASLTGVAEVAMSRCFLKLVLLFTSLLAIPLARQSRLYAFLFTGLQVVGVTLDFLDDVLLLYLPLEPAQRIFERLAFLYANLCQKDYTSKPAKSASSIILENLDLGSNAEAFPLALSSNGMKFSLVRVPFHAIICNLDPPAPELRDDFLLEGFFARSQLIQRLRTIPTLAFLRRESAMA